MGLHLSTKNVALIQLPLLALLTLIMPLLLLLYYSNGFLKNSYQPSHEQRSQLLGPLSESNLSREDMHLKQFVVPDTVHFIFGLRQDFDGKPYGFVQFLSVLSVKLRLNPSNMIVHYAFEPSGIWWNATKELVTLRKVDAPTHVCGRPLYSAAHRADYLRLEILNQFGGIYLDMDVLILKPFHFLRQYDFSLGEEGLNASVGLGNAVLIAKKGASFVKRWRAEYCRHYDSSHWNHYSVRKLFSFVSHPPRVSHKVMLPHRIYRTFQNEANVLPYYAFYMPLWNADGLNELYFHTGQEMNTKDHLAIHLWSEKAKNIQSQIALEHSFLQGKGMFHQTAQSILQEMRQSFDCSILPEEITPC